MFLAVSLVLGLSAPVGATQFFNRTLSVSDVEKIADVEQTPNERPWVMVDTRLSDAFNGWKLDGVIRGGHLPGAVDFSANWLKVEDVDNRQKLLAALATKGIDQSDSVLLYDANGKDAQKVAAFLRSLGYEYIYYFDINAWAADSERPLQRFANYQRIVPAIVVKQLLDGHLPESFEQADDVRIVEASWGDESESYSKGHVPTAFHINTDDIEPLSKVLPPMWMLADDSKLLEFATAHGFHLDDTVIVTGEETLAAYRVASILEYLGVKDVRILNGGTRAWTMAGFALEKQSHRPMAVKDFGSPAPIRPEVIDTLDEVQDKLKKEKDFTLVDNRSRDEFLGKTSGYTYHLKKGRIPDAVYGYAGSGDSYSLDFFRNIDGTMRNPHEFLALWEEQGIDPDYSLSFMCGSGWRAAEVYFYADVAGLKNISIFSDGWIGWSNAGLPTIRGEELPLPVRPVAAVIPSEK